MGNNAVNIKYLKILGWIRDWFNRLRQDKNVVVFLVFLVIATGFWFLNALRKEYTATLSYPVKFVNIPEDKMLPDDFKSRIEVKVRAVGFVILRYQLSNTFLPLTFNVSEMQPLKTEAGEGVYTLTSGEHNKIVGQLSQGMELIDVNPDTLFVPLAEKSSKRVPVRVSADIGFEKQYLQAGPILVQPDSVMISGPKQVIDTVKYIETRELQLEGLADSISTVIPLIIPSQVKASEKRVTAIVPVEPFTELNLRIPLRVYGLPDSLRIKTFPSEIQVSFRVGMSKYGTIDESQFHAVVDASPVLREDRPDRLKVRLDKAPSNVESLSFSPIFVEYLLEKTR
ncbi:CdaR family protein [Anaerophaga thermohalophila]|uniref:CdaR family protein n=1 Tax=Anaerophaga thermohalophila TaxID=177400 RepID=UPI000303EE39|nr:CdaR family protein [Anaerophaga thermohalophila]